MTINNSIEHADVCPKCGSAMKKNLMLQSGGGRKGGGFPIDACDVKYLRAGNREGSLYADVCQNCGYTELYLKER